MTLTSRLSASECVPTDAAALLIGRAKDNHASCAVGPFVRVLDPRFTLDAARRLTFETVVEGPDGLLLFIGTMFAPVDARGTPGSGFTHKTGDVVRIAASERGALVNEVVTGDQAEPWSFGTGALMANLARRGLLMAKGGQ